MFFDQTYFHEAFDIDITLIQRKYKRILSHRMIIRYFRFVSITGSAYVILIPKEPISFLLFRHHIVN